MKNLFALLMFWWITTQTVSAQKASCCQLEATDEFALLASEQEFIESHQVPLPYKHVSDIGKDITYKTSDGTEAHAYELKANKPSKKYLFVIHEWWGLNDYIKRESEKLYNDLGKNVTVIALDLYDRKVALTRDSAAKIMQSITSERAQAIIKGAINYVGKEAKIATIGWCFGGGWSLQSALMAGKQAVACVIYYGMPEKDVEKLKGLNAEVLGIFASQEKYISPQIVGEFEENLKKANITYTIKSFDADHAFANPSNPKHDPKATAQAYKLTIDFLNKKI